MTNTQDIVAKLWNLCHILRDDGVTYQQYVSELTYLLFLKMAQETQTEHRLPESARWAALLEVAEPELVDVYRRALLDLGAAEDPLVRGIYAGANTSLTQPRHLNKLMKDIDALDWYSAREDGLAQLYEGLLEKNASEKKSGAGQYFTPRPLIDSIVALADPQVGEHIQDPAAGTAGFLIAADAHIKAATDQLFDIPEKMQEFQKRHAFVGVELVKETRRLALMNCMLHDILGEPGGDGAIKEGDTLGKAGKELVAADLILTNPPFGTKKGGGGPTREDFTFPTKNKQLAFLQHIYRGLNPGGRAAVVLPDNVLFEEGVGQKIRKDLLDKCRLHTVLRLPTGIFYAAGVKTNVLFFTRGDSDLGNTEEVWFYDLRTNMPKFGKRTPFTRETLKGFEEAFGGDAYGKGPRKDEGESGRFRRFTREEIEARGYNLDISWLRDEEAEAAEAIGDPAEIVAEIQAELKTAMSELAQLEALLGR